MKIIGTINWFRPFCPNLSQKISISTDLLKKLENYMVQLTYRNFKIYNNRIKNCSGIKHPNFKERFILETDASNFGIGAVLYQSKGIIGYYSKKLSPAQSLYSIIGNESLEVPSALRCFRSIIYKSPILVRTDHSNRKYLSSSKFERCQRWNLRFCEFNIDIEYLKGKKSLCRFTV